ncbi:hypothetical protein CASFOL_038523 [Castilleja foliolosa]|uniref:Exocyst subunit Exo70 family protein n=1 Tax=Castilleja foliolosa TaxID=1961234 RepID=A0ABD3BLP8_9LAMI
MEPPEPTAAEKIILQWDSTASEDAADRMIFTGDRHEIDRYLDAVDELQKSISSAVSSDSSSTSSAALQIAMARLEDEFRSILLAHTSPIEADLFTESTQSEFYSQEFEETDKTSSEKRFEHQVSNVSTTSSCYKSAASIREVDLIPSDAAYDLRRIAERMISAGYSRECIQVYASVRKSAVDASLKKLNVEKSSIGDVQRLDWETLETKIRRWIRAARICVRVLFASERRLCEEIFEGLGDSRADDACFMETIKGPAVQLFNFAEAISISRRSPEKLFKILDLHDALSDLLPDIESVFDSKLSESIKIEAVEIISRLAEAARGVLSEFENAILREPSKIPVPGELIIKGSPELREMIGDDYLKSLTGIFRSAATNYQRSTWVRVLHSLRDEGLHVSGSFSSGVSKSALRARFKAFNAMFEEVHRTQSTWLIPDIQLREELRISISEKVIPAYRSFFGRFRSHIESGKHPENYIKYSAEDLENAVLDLFEGHPVSQHLRRRSE